jgi:hypothetical protein
MLVVAEKARDVKGLRAQFAVRFSRFAGSESGVLRERAGTNKICHFRVHVGVPRAQVRHDEAQLYTPIVL